MPEVSKPRGAGIPIAVLGTFVRLPQDVEDRRALFEVCKAKRQVREKRYRRGVSDLWG
jgi:hypothetical protein